MNKELLKSKTFWTAITAVVGMVAAVATGEMAWQTALPGIITAVLSVFVKDAVVSATKGEK